MDLCVETILHHACVKEDSSNVPSYVGHYVILIDILLILLIDI